MVCIIDVFVWKVFYEYIISNVKTTYVEYVGLRKAKCEYIGKCDLTKDKQKIQPDIYQCP